MTSFAPLPSLLSRLRPPLSQSLSPCDLITPLLISFDRRQLIRGQHLDGSHGNRQDQIFWALKGGSRSGWLEVVVEVRGWAMRNALRLTALMDRAEQWPEWCYSATVFSTCVCGCVCVTSFPLIPLPIPWTQWERVE